MLPFLDCNFLACSGSPSFGTLHFTIYCRSLDQTIIQKCSAGIYLWKRENGLFITSECSAGWRINAVGRKQKWNKRKTPATIDQKCLSSYETVIFAERGQNPSVQDKRAWFSTEKDFLTQHFDENWWTKYRIYRSIQKRWSRINNSAKKRKKWRSSSRMLERWWVKIDGKKEKKKKR